MTHKEKIKVLCWSSRKHLWGKAEEFGRKGRGVVRCWGVVEASIKSITIIAMCQAVINKQGMVWTAARVDLMVWVQMAFSHQHCPLAYCRVCVCVWQDSVCGSETKRAHRWTEQLRWMLTCFSGTPCRLKIHCLFVPNKRMIMQVFQKKKTSHSYTLLHDTSSVFKLHINQH